MIFGADARYSAPHIACLVRAVGILTRRLEVTVCVSFTPAASIHTTGQGGPVDGETVNA